VPGSRYVKAAVKASGFFLLGGVFYLTGNHFDEFVDVISGDDAVFLEYDLDARTEFFSGRGSEKSRGDSSDGSPQ